MSSTFQSLRVFNYRLWFLGAAVSNIGTWMQRTAQDWIILTELTDQDAAAVGISLALQFGPVLILTPMTGLVADLFDRRKILLATQIAMGVLGLALAWLYLAGALELWMVYVLSGLLGVTTAFDGPARQAIVSELVTRDKMSNAIGLNSMSMTGARLVGPGVAGLLVAAIGAGWVFLINFVTFAATVAALLAMRQDELLEQQRPTGKRPKMRDGVRYVLSRSDFTVVLLGTFVFSSIALNVSIYLATMTEVEFGADASEYGILSSVVAIGSVAGSLLAARREQPRVWMIGAGALAFGIIAMAAAFSPTIWVFGILIIGFGVSTILSVNTANAYIQVNTPLEIRGRVMAIYMALVLGSNVFGGPLLGWVANVAGPRWAIVVGAVGGFVTAAMLLVWWLVTNRGRLSWSRQRPWRVTVSRLAPLTPNRTNRSS